MQELSATLAQAKVTGSIRVHAVAARKNYAVKVDNIRCRSALCLAMEHHEEAFIAAKPPKNPFDQAVPALLTAAVVGLAGLFMQVAKLDQSVNTVAADIQELKNDSKERLADLESRVRQIEMRIGYGK
jgi:hypothetical protein